MYLYSEYASALPIIDEKNSYQIEFKPPQSVKTKELDKWLFKGFCFMRAEELQVSSAKKETKDVEKLLWYWTQFYHQILIEAGIPVFNPPVVRSMTKLESGRYLVSVDMIPVDHYETLLRETMQATLNCLFAMNKNPYTAESFIKLGEHILKNIYQPIRNQSSSGTSTIPLLSYAYGKGVPFSHLGQGAYQLGIGANLRVVRRSSTDKDAAYSARLSDNKYLATKRLHRSGLPCPQHKAVRTFTEAIKAAKYIGYPLVVKPIAANRGEGVVINIKDEHDLETGFDTAKKVSETVLIEKQAKGNSYRLFIHANKLMYVNQNSPRVVTGDGVSTIHELLEKDANTQLLKRPWAREPAIPLDNETLQCLQRQSLTLKSIVDVGRQAEVRAISSTQWGSSRAAYRGEIHPDNEEAAVKAAKLFHLDTAGIDFIIEDPSRPWYEQGAIINEINYSPMIGASQASLDAIPKIFDQMIKGDGRVPVHLYIGGEQALIDAQAQQKKVIEQGARCYLASHDQLLDSEQKAVHMPFKTLIERTQALCQDIDVDAMILVVQTDEYLSHGFAIDLIDSLTVSDRNITSAGGEKISEEVLDRMIGHFTSLLKKSSNKKEG